LIKTDSHHPHYLLCIQFRQGSPFTSSLHHDDDNSPDFQAQNPTSSFDFLKTKILLSFEEQLSCWP